jgi:rhamnose utilization protein RhaD (predicted bifunctional aldolase and dehydrogenase)
MDELIALRALSAEVGADPLLVQGPGGNTSLKHDGVMWIKASGTWLLHAEAQDIFVPVDHAALMSALGRNDPSCEACTDFVRGDLCASGLRPSIETTVHALLPQRVVVHVHCVNTIAHAICRDGEARLKKVLTGFNWAWIPYARPGLPLAGAISARLKPGLDVLVLGNHGLAVAAQTVAAAEALLRRAVKAVQRPVRDAPDADKTALDILLAGTPYRAAPNRDAHALATDALALARGRRAVFYPDHAVFLGVGVATDLASGEPLVAIPGVGVAIRDEAKPAIAPMGRCLADVMRRIAVEDELVSLTAREIGELVNWDAEKYRQALNPI